jgi:hypothetical protein
MNEFGFTQYTYKGEPIIDIFAWAKERGEKMLRVKMERTIPNLRTGKLEIERQDLVMPESFWATMRIADRWIVKKTTEIK